MKNVIAALAFVAVLSWGALAQAGLIVAASAAADGDGAVTCASAWDFGAQTMSIVGNQYWGPGHIGTLPLSNAAALVAESEDDPIVTLRTTMDNDTGFSWTGYHVAIYMNKSFTVTLPTVHTPDTSESGWHVASYVEQSLKVGDKWVAQVDFAGGTPIPDGGALDFSYKLTFMGSAQYCQEMTPVPEPGTIALAITGLVALFVLRRRYR